MRIALLGRTRALLETGKVLIQYGHQIVLVATGRPSSEDSCSIDDYRSAADNWGSEFLERVDVSHLKVLLDQTRPDLGVSSNYPIILPAEIVDIPSYGILNSHGGDLPRYRGNACQAWAILQGEPHVALCIHRMIGGEVDSGDIIVREKLTLTDSTKIAAIIEWLATMIPNCFLEAVRAIEKNREYFLERQSTDPAKSLRCFPRRPEDGRIRWDLGPVEIVRLVNASGPPYAGAYCELDGRRVIVLSAVVACGLSPYLAVPGQVMALTKDSVTVACRGGAVEIQEAQLEDGTPLRELVRSIRARLT